MIWIGGTGDWNVATNWDTGLIPTIDNIPRIQNSTDTVFIPSGFTANAKRLEIDSGATLIVADITATLIITGNELANKGNVINRGLISSVNAGFGSDAIENFKGRIENFGSITVDNSQGYGIKNYWESVFINHSGSTISIENTGRSGLNNSGNFTNNGIIQLVKSKSFGALSNQSYNDFFNDTVFIATFTNTGEINIFKTEGAFSSGIRNNGVFNNENIIAIDSTEDDGIYNSGISADIPGIFSNSGTITMGLNTAISGNSAGIQNNFNGQFVNEVGGVITIDSISHANLNIEKNGINNSTATSIFTNLGIIDILYSKYGVKNAGTFVNGGDLYTRNIGFTHITNQGQEAQLTNNGRLITRANFGFGVRILNTGGAVIENNGLIHQGSIWFWWNCKCCKFHFYQYGFNKLL